MPGGLEESYEYGALAWAGQQIASLHRVAACAGVNEAVDRWIGPT